MKTWWRWFEDDWLSFRHPPVEASYQSWLRQIWADNDWYSGIILTGYETVCMLKIMQKRPPDAMPIAVHVTLVACLAALSLLPIYKPAAWVAHRNLLAMLAMLNVTLVGAFCVNLPSISVAVLGTSHLAQLVDSGACIPSIASNFYIHLPLKRKCLALLLCFSATLCRLWYFGRQEDSIVRVLSVLCGVLIPLVLSWRLEYRSRYRFLLQIRRGGRGRDGWGPKDALFRDWLAISLLCAHWALDTATVMLLASYLIMACGAGRPLALAAQLPALAAVLVINVRQYLF